jgi:ABC-type phosphate transport system substrate-binding protein
MPVTGRGILYRPTRNRNVVAAFNVPARVVALASVLALAWAIVASERPPAAQAAAKPKGAATVLYGGGADMPAFALAGTGDADTHSVFGYFATVSHGYRVSYCATGSGFGKAVFAGRVAASGACAASGALPTGFGAASDAADFAVSDVPLTAGDVRAFGRNASARTNAIFGRGNPVQVPVLAGTVAIVYRNPDVSGRLNLAIDTLCRVADGEIVNWNQIPLDPSNPAGLKYPARRLRFVYHSDRSGMTFALANFLSARDAHGNRRACTRPGETFGLNDVFDLRDAAEGPQSATGVLPAPLPAGASTQNFLGAFGDAALLDCVARSDGSCRSLVFGQSPAQPSDGPIGYASGATAAAAAALDPNLGIATLDAVQSGIERSYDPIADLPAAATLLDGYVTGQVLALFRANERATLVAAPDAKTGACIATIPPDSYAYPPAGYPIVAVVNFDFSTAGNGRRAAALRGIATVADSSRALTGKRIRSVDRDAALAGMTGYSVLPLPIGRKSGIPSVARCIGP